MASPSCLTTAMWLPTQAVQSQTGGGEGRAWDRDSGEEADGEKESARAISGTDLARSPGLQKGKLDWTIQSRD